MKQGQRKKLFILLELVMITIIIASFITIGYSHDVKFLLKGKAAEARMVLHKVLMLAYLVRPQGIALEFKSLSLKSLSGSLMGRKYIKKGFTLLELIVVIIIIGILATLGFAQYTKTLEKGRTAEAKLMLGQIRKAQEAYYLENTAYATDITLLAVNAPTGCTATHYFSYSAVGTTTAAGIGTALRCTTLGKTPQAGTQYTVNVTWATGTWGGTSGYY
jgi:prepilin-type N-terminal cleavage/methylation domain-containing protein